MSAYKPSMLRVRGLIAQDKSLAMLLPEAERLRELNARFGKAVTPAVARVCRVVALQGDTALVQCGNGAAASRLRSLATTVARALSTEVAPVASLKIKLRADWNLPARPEKKGMGESAVQAWVELEAQLPEGGLKAAIDRLVHHQQAR